MMRRMLRAFAWWILATVKPTPDEIDAAMQKAFVQAGVALDTPTESDLGVKRYEVLHHAAIALGNPLRTVADIKELLK